MNRQQAPQIIDATDFELQLKPYERYVLKNGVEVITVQAGAQEVMSLEWVFDAGNWYDEHKKIAATTNFLLKNGTTHKTAFDINEHFEYYGSFLNRTCYNETATISLHTPTKQLDHLLPVVREMITDAVFPQEELAIYCKNSKQKLQVNVKKCDFVASQLIDAYVYGEQHPYGIYSRLEDYDHIERDQLLAFYDRYYRKGHCIIFAAGKLPDNFEQQMNQYFGDLPLQPRITSRSIIPFEPATEKKYRITNDADGVQGAIRMARSFPGRKDPDFPKVQVLNALFGGFFGSRLMSNIREDKGYTYGIYSYLQNHLQGSAWMISTEAGRDVCEATIKEVYHEMQLLCDEEPDEEELQLVKNYMMGSLLGDLDGPFHIIARWKNIILHGLDENHFYRSVEAIKTATSGELKVLANKYFRPEDFYELVVV
ncbi:MAG: M16 family metallopeptidase [Bacteroidota bacterium]|jgi:zinc protease